MAETNGAASEGDVSAEETTTPTELNEAQKAQVAEMVAGESKKWEKHFQGIADRDIGVANRKAQGLTQRLKATEQAHVATRGRLMETDPTLAGTLEVEELRAQNRVYQQSELDGEQSRQMVEVETRWRGGLHTILKGMGVDPSDTKLDWGTNLEPNDFLGIQERVMTSASKIVDENKNTEFGKLRTELDDKFAQFRKDQGLDSPDTTTPPGAAGVRKVTKAELRKMPAAEYQELVKEGKLQIV